MKSFYCVFLCGVIGMVNIAFSGTVNLNQAKKCAAWFVESKSPMLGDISPVTNTIPYRIDGKTLYYVAYRANGGAILINANDSLHPILAVVDNIGNMSTNLCHSSPLQIVMNSVSKKQLAVVDRGQNTNVITKTKGIMLKSSVKNKSSLTQRKSRNTSVWNAVKKHTCSATSTTPRFAATSSISQDDSKMIIISGFEKGGRLTHWNQTNARTGTGSSAGGTLPCYNFYMCCATNGGSNVNGLRVAKATATGTYALPCGCAATAMSAVLQAVGMGGIKAAPQYAISEWDLPSPDIDGNTVKTNARMIPGTYDWSILPYNYGGSAPSVTNANQLTYAQRELLGRVAYNCGVTLHMQYGYSGSGASASDFAGGLNYSWGLRTYGDTLNQFGAYWHVDYAVDSEISVSDAIRNYIYANVPVCLAIFTSYTGHCVNGVGYYIDNSKDVWIRIFMGWSGEEDCWVNFSDWEGIAGYAEIGAVIYPSIQDNRALPWAVYTTGNSVKVVESIGSITTNTITRSGRDIFGGMAKVHGVGSTPTNGTFNIIGENGVVIKNDFKMKKSGTYAIPDLETYDIGRTPSLINSINPFGFGKATPDAWWTSYKIPNKVLVVCGDSLYGTGMDWLVNKYADFIDDNFTYTYFINTPYETRAIYKDCQPSISVYDMHTLTQKIWYNPTNIFLNTNGRIVYGTFTNEYDFVRLLEKAIR